MPSALIWLDSLLIAPFRWLSFPVAAYLIGSSWLALLSVLVGQGVLALASRLTKDPAGPLSEEALKQHTLSLRALREGEGDAYRATNRLANEAFGKLFFHSVARGAGALFPAFFAVGWLELRFAHLSFPLPGTSYTLSFLSPFVVSFIFWRLGLSYLMRRLSRRQALELDPSERDMP